MEVNPSICLCQLHGAYVSSTLSRQLTNFQISHLFSHPVNIHVHHQSVTSSVTLSTSMTSTPMTTSNIISLSIINCQSLISKVLSRYLYSPGSHQSSRFNSVSVMALKMYSVSENPVKIEKNSYNIYVADYWVKEGFAVKVQCSIRRTKYSSLRQSQIDRLALIPNQEPRSHRCRQVEQNKNKFFSDGTL